MVVFFSIVHMIKVFLVKVIKTRVILYEMIEIFLSIPEHSDYYSPSICIISFHLCVIESTRIFKLLF